MTLGGRMATDGEAAAEIGRQMALLRGRVARRGVMGYLVGLSASSGAAGRSWADGGGRRTTAASART